jgi:hypothetical protein
LIFSLERLGVIKQLPLPLPGLVTLVHGAA